MVVLCAAFALFFANLAEVHSRDLNSARSQSLSSSSYKPPKLYSCLDCNSKDHYVEPHIRKNGEFVQGHMKTDSNKTSTDNFTQRGNTNPYTGEPGDRN